MKNIIEKIKEVYYNNPVLVLFLTGVLTGLFLAFIF
jgi:uncharacterized membrane protein (DUF106 family)